jgi:tetratricopeptide (TPR) repeat protein
MRRPAAIAVLAIACRAAAPSVPAAAPPDAVAAMDRAERAIDEGRPSEAVADARLAVDLAPADARAHRVVGLLMEARDDASGALEAYARSLALRDDAQVRRRAAQLATSLGRHEVAVEHWEQACALDPGDVAAKLALAMACERADRPATAQAAYEKAVAMSPDNPALRRRYAAFLEGQGRPSLARAQRALYEPAAPASPTVKAMRTLPPSAR